MNDIAWFIGIFILAVISVLVSNWDMQRSEHKK